MLRICLVALMLMGTTLVAQEKVVPAAPEAPAAAEAPAAPVAPAAPTAPEKPAAPETKIMVKKVEELHAVVLPMKGSYDQHQDAISKLMGYITDSLMVAPMGPPFGRYHNNPMEAKEADLSWEVGMEVAPGTTAAAPFEALTLPASEVVYTIFTGPYEQSGSAWPGLYMWAMSGGYTPSGPPMELWMGGEGPQTELRLYVTKPAPATAP